MLKNQINTKNIIILLIASLIFFMTSCGGNNTGNGDDATNLPTEAVNLADAADVETQIEDDASQTEDANVSAIDNSETEISVMTQEYIGDNKAEILMISYNGQQPALEEYGWRNPEIEMINNAIKNGIQQIYNEFIGRENVDLIDEREWIEIRSYPFTTDEWLQIVTHYNTYPTYGNSGYVESYNFNKRENKCYTVYDAIEAEGLSEESLIEEATELFTQQSPYMTVDEVRATGFIIKQGFEELVTQFWFEVTAKNSDGDSWRGIFSYVRGYEFMEVIGEFLYDPDEMDIMDPPLLYQSYTDGALG